MAMLNNQMVSENEVKTQSLRGIAWGLTDDPMAAGDRSDFHVIYPAAWKLWSFTIS